MAFKLVLVAPLLLASAAVTAAFVQKSPIHASITRQTCRSPSSRLQATAVDAIASLSSSQAATVQTIAAAIPDLEVKPDFCWNGEAVAGSSATLDARDAPGPANIAWLSALSVDSKLVSLTIFNGPLTDVPHLVSRCVVINESTMRLTLDARPRSNGGWEMRREDGSYPGPDELGRQAFEFSGNRMDFEKKFGTEELKSFLSGLVSSLEGATPYIAPASDLDKLTRGPLYTCLEMPVTDSNVAAVVAAREKMADIWLSWAKDPAHDHRPGAPVNTQYVYDTKFKQNAYGSLLEEYSALFGPQDGQRLAVGESGPLDEAYVGGGS
ncbi:hypothetical protein IV203_013491 [Nitzschia inconspicua]|uniref:Uncharacterized protein n=1 Tax=Nitzschia inconspicua TaxID=303405 RepID=A0A9K3Q829_9STRA|nr:hypothetical protein IV203_013491 [Nitzschia inconspicua]